MSWKPTPQPELFRISRYVRDSGAWAPTDFASLVRGDIFAAFNADGDQVDPSTGEPSDVVSLAEAEAEKNLALGQGYQVRAMAGALSDLIAAGAQ